jgi:tetratricopeptide (TPR) repeat protein
MSKLRLHCGRRQGSTLHLPEAWYNLGDLLDDQGRSAAAVECLRKSLQAAPDYANAIFNLALLLQRRNECAEAAIYWRRFLAIDSQS